MPLVEVTSEQVLSAAHNQAGIARLIAAAAPHSGAFLQAVPCSAVGTRLDDTSLRIAVALRLGCSSLRASLMCLWSCCGSIRHTRLELP